MVGLNGPFNGPGKAGELPHHVGLYPICRPNMVQGTVQDHFIGITPVQSYKVG